MDWKRLIVRLRRKGIFVEDPSREEPEPLMGGHL